MKSVSGKHLCRLAERKGWKLARISGSHHVFIKNDSNERLVIPVHGKESLKIGLLRSLMKRIPLEPEDL